jgi:Rieske Fe-S protein
MSSNLTETIKKILSDDKNVRQKNRSHQHEFPYDRDKEAQVTRREFCNFLGLTSTAFLLGTVGFAAKSAYDASQIKKFSPLKIEGAVSLEKNSALNFRYPTTADPAILIRSEEGKYYAFDQKCTHLLCPVYYSKEHSRLECPCHEGGFSAQTGDVLYGPPPRPLNRIVLEEKNGELWAVGVITGGKEDERS